MVNHCCRINNFSLRLRRP